MREIRFRAWDGKKMYLPEYTEKEDFHLLADGSIVETHEYGYERHELTSRRGDEWLVMQFTGLKDKNGKEIYEGDILGRITDKDFVFVVDFADGGFSGLTEPGRIHRLSLSKAMTLERSPYIEVIGNIYENPELISKPTPQ